MKTRSYSPPHLNYIWHPIKGVTVNHRRGAIETGENIKYSLPVLTSQLFQNLSTRGPYKEAHIPASSQHFYIPTRHVRHGNKEARSESQTAKKIPLLKKNWCHTKLSKRDQRNNLLKLQAWVGAEMCSYLKKKTCTITRVIKENAYGRSEHGYR